MSKSFIDALTRVKKKNDNKDKSILHRTSGNLSIDKPATIKQYIPKPNKPDNTLANRIEQRRNKKGTLKQPPPKIVKNIAERIEKRKSISKDKKDTKKKKRRFSEILRLIQEEGIEMGLNNRNLLDEITLIF